MVIQGLSLIPYESPGSKEFVFQYCVGKKMDTALLDSTSVGNGKAQKAATVHTRLRPHHLSTMMKLASNGCRRLEVRLGFRCWSKLRVTKAITYLIRVQGFRNSVQLAKQAHGKWTPA